MPAQNEPPAPVSTIEQTSSSSSASTQPTYRPTSIGSESAILASGLLSVSTSVARSRCLVRCSGPPMAISPLQEREQVAVAGEALQEFSDRQSDFFARTLHSCRALCSDDRRTGRCPGTTERAIKRPGGA